MRKKTKAKNDLCLNVPTHLLLELENCFDLKVK